ncbi:MAG: hypothetical protein GF364_03315 [Candidatus Lokiarchaeota archaeon]|nr:hypothetical protein [Candidatus Lokiarchaeota archaeon]
MKKKSIKNKAILYAFVLLCLQIMVGSVSATEDIFDSASFNNAGSVITSDLVDCEMWSLSQGLASTDEIIYETGVGGEIGIIFSNNLTWITDLLEYIENTHRDIEDDIYNLPVNQYYYAATIDNPLSELLYKDVTLPTLGLYGDKVYSLVPGEMNMDQGWMYGISYTYKSLNFIHVSDIFSACYISDIPEPTIHNYVSLDTEFQSVETGEPIELKFEVINQEFIDSNLYIYKVELWIYGGGCISESYMNTRLVDVPYMFSIDCDQTSQELDHVNIYPKIYFFNGTDAEYTEGFSFTLNVYNDRDIILFISIAIPIGIFCVIYIPSLRTRRKMALQNMKIFLSSKRVEEKIGKEESEEDFMEEI